MQFIGTMMLVMSALHCSPEKKLEIMDGYKFPVFAYCRLKEILERTRAYSALGRTGSSTRSWDAQGDDTPKFMECR